MTTVLRVGGDLIEIEHLVERFIATEIETSVGCGCLLANGDDLVEELLIPRTQLVQLVLVCQIRCALTLIDEARTCQHSQYQGGSSDPDQPGRESWNFSVSSLQLGENSFSESFGCPDSGQARKIFCQGFW